MKALVTGGGGFLGRYIAEGLLTRGDAVCVIGRRRYADLEALGIECRVVDLGDQSSVEAVCEGVDVVFHVAAKAGYWGDPAEFDRTNVQGTRHVISGCLKAGVGRLVHTSTPSVVAHPGLLENVNEDQPYPPVALCDYQRTKILAEKDVLAANGDALKTVSLRPHIIFGPRDPHFIPRIVARARAGQIRRVGDGTNRVDVIYVENAAAAHLAAADALVEGRTVGGRAYFISQGEPVRLWEFLDRILEGLGLPPIKKSVPFGVAWYAGSVLEAVHRLLRLGGEPRMTRFLAVQLGQSHWFDVSRARDELGFQPTISTDEGLARLFAYVSEHGLQGLSI